MSEEVSMSKGIPGSKTIYEGITISWVLYPTVPELDVTGRILGIDVGSVTVNDQGVTATLGTNPPAEVTLNADFSNKKVNYSLKVNLLLKTITQEGTLVEW